MQLCNLGQTKDNNRPTVSRKLILNCILSLSSNQQRNYKGSSFKGSEARFYNHQGERAHKKRAKPLAIY